MKWHKEHVRRLKLALTTWAPAPMKWRKRQSRHVKWVLFILENALLYLHIATKRGRAPEQIFQHAWGMLARKYLVADPGCNLGRKVAPQGLHYRLRQTFKIFHRDFRPSISLLCSPTALEVMRKRPGIIVTIHAFSEHAVASAMDKSGIATGFVATLGFNENNLTYYRFRDPPIHIPKTPVLMLDCRSAIRHGRNVICDVDYKVGSENAPLRYFISPAIFQFRRKIEAPLFFAHARITPLGAIECIVRLFDGGGRQPGSAETDAQAFIGFLNEVEGREFDFTVRARPDGHGKNSALGM
jgi:hypothetical protein